MSNSKYRWQTEAIHAGYTPEATTGSRAVPIYQTTSYVFRDADHAAALFGLRELGNIYTRLMNPTTDVFEKRVAALEGGKAALALASGQAAETVAITSLAKAGDEVVSASSLYGGTYSLFANTLPRFGITTRFVEAQDLDQVRAAITDKTRALYVETLSNPRLDVADFEGLAEVAHEAKLPLLVDNTVGTPALVNPIAHGADIVLHSATKYIGGHGTSLGGIIVDAGNFDWSSGRFAEFTEPHPAYHGLKLTEAFGDLAFIMRARLEGLRDLGGALSPFNAHAFILGLETLGLRMQRHSENALQVAEFLKSHPKVASVNYPMLKDSPSYARAQKYMKGGSGLVSFELKAGREAGKKLMNSVKLFSLLANIGDTRSLIIHPASTTHEQLSDAQQLSAGVTPGLVRLSVGIEDVADILNDLDQALAQLG